jgi:hypothetical protein
VVSVKKLGIPINIRASKWIMLQIPISPLFYGKQEKLAKL